MRLRDLLSFLGKLETDLAIFKFQYAENGGPFLRKPGRSNAEETRTRLCPFSAKARDERRICYRVWRRNFR